MSDAPPAAGAYPGECAAAAGVHVPQRKPAEHVGGGGGQDAGNGPAGSGGAPEPAGQARADAEAPEAVVRRIRRPGRAHLPGEQLDPGQRVGGQGAKRPVHRRREDREEDRRGLLWRGVPGRLARKRRCGEENQEVRHK